MIGRTRRWRRVRYAGGCHAAGVSCVLALASSRKAPKSGIFDELRSLGTVGSGANDGPHCRHHRMKRRQPGRM
jgi:hypothetical protein